LEAIGHALLELAVIERDPEETTIIDPLVPLPDP